ncbi:histidine kinase [Ferrovum sp.]|uniref:sensor histidine kinase n=1 Tax=Ferrovum sp. TaxID=2609467 RepID=UPI00262BD5C5|nr:histidine kinase [Ferrovum sp.]
MGLLLSDAKAEALRLDQGEFVFDQSQTPLALPQSRWTPVKLPDNWDLSHPFNGGVGWYRFSFTLDHSPSDLWAVYLPRLSVNARVFINGQLVGSGGRFTEPISHNNYRPLFFSFPGPLLHAGENRIALNLIGFAQEGSGLGPFQIGPVTALNPAYNSQHFREVIVPTISFTLLLLLSFILFIIWLRRRQETLYLMFSLCGGFSTLYTAIFFIQEVPWLTHHQWLWVELTAAMCYVYCLMLLIHRFVKIQRPSLEKFFLIYTIVGPILIFFLPSPYLFRAFGILGLGYCAVSLYILFTIYQYRHQCLPSETWLLFFSILFSALTGYHDLAYMLHSRHEIPVLIFYWGSTVLGIAIAFLLLLRFDRSLVLFETLNRDLNSLVAEKSRTLAQSYQERQTLEMRQAVFGERERIMRDLHDGLGGYLVSAMVQAERHPPQLRTLQQTLRSALEDLRLMIDSLDGDPTDLGTQMGSLRERLESLMESSGAVLHWQVEDSPRLPSPSTSNTLQLMRMVQEIFTNIAKHSHACHVFFSVGARHLEVRDDGEGFDVSTTRSGRGLPHLYSRAQQLGITLNISSSASGTTLHLTW